MILLNTHPKRQKPTHCARQGRRRGGKGARARHTGAGANAGRNTPAGTTAHVPLFCPLVSTLIILIMFCSGFLFTVLSPERNPRGLTWCHWLQRTRVDLVRSNSRGLTLCHSCAPWQNAIGVGPPGRGGGFRDHLSVPSVASICVVNVPRARWGRETGSGRAPHQRGRAMDDGGAPPVIAEA